MSIPQAYHMGKTTGQIDPMAYLKNLELIASMDIETLKQKEATYKGSWKKRGGIGAFMMLARKWDRLENIVEAVGYDVFKAIENDSDNDEITLEQIRDLRRYFLLVEAEIMHRRL